MWNHQYSESGESPERSEIQLEDSHHNEHPKSPLIPDLTRAPAVPVGSFKKWLSRTVSIVVQKPEEPREQEPRDLMEPPAVLDLKLGGLFRYHLNDWLLIVIIFVLWILSFLIHPFQRYVGETNFVTQQLRYPYKSNTIPFQVVPVIAVGIPLVVILGIFFKRRNLRDLHHAILGLLTAVALTALITDVVKIGIGRPRPHFYARCFGSPTSPPNYDPITGNVICSATANQMKEAYKSFPSGHTSWTFAGLSYLAMYMAGKLSIFDRKGHSWKVFPIVLTMLGATFVGVTRIDDYWHHWTDVCTGASIGIVTAYFCYRQHFRSLFDDLPHMTYDYIPHTHPRPVIARQVSAPVVSSYDMEQGRL
ncbi:hypothetical protein M758_3G048400 [Ceratodon purpureus]|uniref:Phosphatidic acid phosphatase type 2/haloperoxidase domain-containing protein n=1 Tax=Ceratodon purpureus TaxID=3225 RepID=A0A8T0IIK3_CERPU|nr:hypothetical protein KC19_3G049300 [Ceratodon purpureus]KAG0621789.1 hypothetical protein M758_3G048400 [Ceratodon purpureus]